MVMQLWSALCDGTLFVHQNCSLLAGINNLCSAYVMQSMNMIQFNLSELVNVKFYYCNH